MFLLTSHAHTIPPPSYHPTTPLPPADPSHTLINTRHHPPSTLSLDGHSQPAVTTQSPSPNPPAPDHLSPPTHATTLSPDDTHSHTHMPPPVTAYPCHYSLPWWHSLTHTHVTTCLRLLHLRMRYHWLTFIFTPDLLTYKVFFRSRKCMLR